MFARCFSYLSLLLWLTGHFRHNQAITKGVWSFPVFTKHKLIHLDLLQGWSPIGRIWGANHHHLHSYWVKSIVVFDCRCLTPRYQILAVTVWLWFCREKGVSFECFDLIFGISWYGVVQLNSSCEQMGDNMRFLFPKAQETVQLDL